MDLQDLGLIIPLQTHSNGFGSAPTSRNLSASTHWIGGQFIAPVTDTIDKILFQTSSGLAPIVLQLEAAITNLDANGFPLGSDIGVSSNSITNPSATTIYTLTASVSVTAGNWYGIILRIKSGTYTSGQIAVRQLANYDMWGGNATGSGPVYPGSHYNLGSNTSSNASLVMPIHYQNNGWIHTLGLQPFGTYSSLQIYGVGSLAGNKFTLDHNVKIIGYLVNGEFDSNSATAIYAGTHNTAVSNSTATLTSAYRGNLAIGVHQLMLPSPLTLSPGTYRVAIGQTTGSDTTIRSLSLPESGMQATLGAGIVTTMKKTTWYFSPGGPWVDTDTDICAICPIISAVDVG